MAPEILEYLRRLRCNAASATYHRKRYMVEAFARYCSEQGTALLSATKADVEAYLRTHDRCCHETRRMICCAIRELYRFLDVSDNPTAAIQFRRHPRRLINLPPKAAILASVEGVDGLASELALRNKLMVELAYGSGLRKGELLRLNVEDLDLTQATAYVQGKGKRTRIVPLTAKSVAAARAYLENRRAMRGPLLVSLSGRRLGGLRIYQVFREQTGYRPHIFRHACASHMLANGCSLRLIQELLGHSLLTTTQRYTHINREELAAVLHQHHPRATSVPQNQEKAYGKV
jgi:integrase/recombinase XerC